MKESIKRRREGELEHIDEERGGVREEGGSVKGRVWGRRGVKGRDWGGKGVKGGVWGGRGVKRREGV